MNALEHPTRLWEQITTGFRQACHHRRHGRQAEATNLLEGALPRTIADWSQASPTEPARKKALLLEMFAREQQRVEEAIALQELVTRHCAEELIPSLRAELAAEVRKLVLEQMGPPGGDPGTWLGRDRDFHPAPPKKPRPARIPFDDLPAVIDAVLADQRTGRTDQARPRTAQASEGDPPMAPPSARRAKSCPWS